MTRVIRQQFSKIGENLCGGDGVSVMIYVYIQAQHQKKYNKILSI